MLGRAQLNGDEWNLGVTTPAEGDVRMSMTPTGGLTVRGELPVAPPCTAATCLAPSANTWVHECTPMSRTARTRAGPPPRRRATQPCVSRSRSARSRPTWSEPPRTPRRCRRPPTTSPTTCGSTPPARNPPAERKGRSRSCCGPITTGRRSFPRPRWQPPASPMPWMALSVTARTPGRPMSSTFTGRECTSPYGGTVFLVLDAGDVVPAGTVSVDVTKALSAVGSLLAQDYGWRISPPATGWTPCLLAWRWDLRTQPWGTGSTDFTLRLASYCLGSAPRAWPTRSAEARKSVAQGWPTPNFQTCSIALTTSYPLPEENGMRATMSSAATPSPGSEPTYRASPKE